ncbi:hypothetical protein [Maritimibacter sp. UBA3975]|uniref:hypothetical protein n=1 Tax=Maritimibacter sp. UBA3975 TaxID=1946833 RepID=UPI000C0B6EEC|nr:hypothetical protein [Maritimibacter sp. UBA3975]MAM61596.1 hypothetical protein [Maritimibacter sp.]|tara:strand:+ start:2359 stop:3777 length:1419 start_codon:yes stop_codon:yes gene_type:complete
MENIGATRARGITISGIAARPLDRLGLITLLSSIYFFQIWGLTMGGTPLPPALHGVFMGMSVAGIVHPRLWGVLLINAFAWSATYLLNSPVASNNQTTAFAFSLVVLGAALMVRPSGEADRDRFFHRVASAGRLILPAMYFFGIYHKINIDFLDPAVSCAVVLYKALFNGIGLGNWSFGQYGAIYATFIIEGIAMIALFIPRLKTIGILIGVPFHIIIGFTGYAYYKDFSTIVLVLYALFLPKEVFTNALDAATRWAGSQERALKFGRWALILFVIAYVAAMGALLDPVRFIPDDRSFMPFFALYALGFYAFLILFMPRDGGAKQGYRAGWLLIIPMLYFANGWSPYLGLKTESSVAMFSNLHTEGGETNHLFHGVLPFGAGYQEALVTPVASNSPGFDARFVAPGYDLVRYELDRMLATTPGLEVMVQTEAGVVSTASPGWANTYLAHGLVAQKFLTFKPVDWARPKVCSH